MSHTYVNKTYIAYSTHTHIPIYLELHKHPEYRSTLRMYTYIRHRHRRQDVNQITTTTAAPATLQQTFFIHINKQNDSINKRNAVQNHL